MERRFNNIAVNNVLQNIFKTFSSQLLACIKLIENTKENYQISLKYKSNQSVVWETIASRLNTENNISVKEDYIEVFQSTLPVLNYEITKHDGFIHRNVNVFSITARDVIQKSSRQRKNNDLFPPISIQISQIESFSESSFKPECLETIPCTQFSSIIPSNLFNRINFTTHEVNYLNWKISYKIGIYVNEVDIRYLGLNDNLLQEMLLLFEMIYPEYSYKSELIKLLAPKVPKISILTNAVMNAYPVHDCQIIPISGFDLSTYFVFNSIWSSNDTLVVQNIEADKQASTSETARANSKSCIQYKDVLYKEMSLLYMPFDTTSTTVEIMICDDKNNVVNSTIHEFMPTFDEVTSTAELDSSRELTSDPKINEINLKLINENENLKPLSSIFNPVDGELGDDFEDWNEVISIYHNFIMIPKQTTESSDTRGIADTTALARDSSSKLRGITIYKFASSIPTIDENVTTDSMCKLLKTNNTSEFNKELMLYYPKYTSIFKHNDFYNIFSVLIEYIYEKVFYMLQPIACIHVFNENFIKSNALCKTGKIHSLTIINEKPFIAEYLGLLTKYNLKSVKQLNATLVLKEHIPVINALTNIDSVSLISDLIDKTPFIGNSVDVFYIENQFKYFNTFDTLKLLKRNLIEILNESGKLYIAFFNLTYIENKSKELKQKELERKKELEKLLSVLPAPRTSSKKSAKCAQRTTASSYAQRTTAKSRHNERLNESNLIEHLLSEPENVITSKPFSILDTLRFWTTPTKQMVNPTMERIVTDENVLIRFSETNAKTLIEILHTREKYMNKNTVVISSVKLETEDEYSTIFYNYLPYNKIHLYIHTSPLMFDESDVKFMLTSIKSMKNMIQYIDSINSYCVSEELLNHLFGKDNSDGYEKYNKSAPTQQVLTHNTPDSKLSPYSTYTVTKFISENFTCSETLIKYEHIMNSFQINSYESFF